MSLQILNLIAQSGDATVLALHHEQQYLHIQLQLFETDDIIHLKIKTQYLINTYTGQQTTCYLQLRELEQSLQIQHGVYLASPHFIDFMQETKNGFHLAYGLRVSQYHYLFSLLGDFQCHAVVRDLQDIEITTQHGTTLS